MSVHFWGEDPKGVWTLAVTDNSNNNREHHRRKSQYGDFEDATEEMQDELEFNNDMDAEHDAIVDEADEFANTEEFQNKVFEDDIFPKLSKSKQEKLSDRLKVKEDEESKLREEQQHKEKLKLKQLQEEKHLRKEKLKLKQLQEEKQLRKSKKKNKKKKQLNDSKKVLDQTANSDEKDALINEVIGQDHVIGAEKVPYIPSRFPITNSGQSALPGSAIPNIPSSLVANPFPPPYYAGVNNENPQQSISHSSANQVSSALHNAPINFTGAPATGATASITNQSSNTSASNFASSSEENKMLENVLKTVLSETFANFRNESEGSYRNFDDRLNELENVLKKSNDSSINKVESITSSLVKAFKSGKAIDKINNVLNVLESSKNQSKSPNTSSYKNSEVVSDVLKVLKDILSTSKDDSKLKRYKERISKLLETSSNKTRKLTDKLFTDLQPQEEGKDVSPSVITDALALVSHLFKEKKPMFQRQKQSSARINTKLPKNVRIVLQGPKGDVILPYEMVTPENTKKEVTTMTSSKEMHHADNTIDTITVQHRNIRHKSKDALRAEKEGHTDDTDFLGKVDSHRNIAEESEEALDEVIAGEVIPDVKRLESTDILEPSNNIDVTRNPGKEKSYESDASGEPDNAESNSLTISVVKNGRLIKDHEIKLDNPEKKLINEKNEKQKAENNIDIEVMFDKDVNKDISNKHGLNNYENLEEIQKLNVKNEAVDVAKFGAQDDSGKSDHFEDVSGLQWQDTSTKKTKKKAPELQPVEVQLNQVKKDKHSYKKKKRNPVKSHKRTHNNHLNHEEVRDYNIEPLPFLQFADPNDISQIPQNEDEDSFIRSLYEPYNLHTNRLEIPAEEKASYYPPSEFQQDHQNWNIKRSYIAHPKRSYRLHPKRYLYNTTKEQISTTGRNQSKRFFHKFSNDVLQKGSSEVNDVKLDLDDDNSDDGPHVVKRSAIFSDLYSPESSQFKLRKKLQFENERRSAVKKAYKLEEALKRKIVSMRKESSSVLNIIKRVHDDISVGDSKDLRVLEKELSQLENAKHNSLYNGESLIEQKTPLVRTKVSRKPLRESKDDPDEYYKYGVTKSGELETWTLLFYGTGP